MKEFKLPPNLLLGSATAATQIEGGDTNSNWYHWSLAGKIANNESSITGSDHVNQVDGDIKLMKELNQEIYRMSIEWSRIEPQKGYFSAVGIEYYRDELTKLCQAGIKPLVTLHHFSSPQWFQEMGGFVNPESINLFVKFVTKVVIEFGDLVSEYCTINEPNVFLNDTYIDGKYPPGEKNNTIHYFKAAKHLILSHLECYELIHNIRRQKGYNNTMVGFAHHEAYFDVASKNPILKLNRFLLDFSFHKIFLKGMIKGKILFSLFNRYPKRKGVYCDFIGINYYSRHLISLSSNPATFFSKVGLDPQVPAAKLNDLKWEIFPKGLTYSVQKIYHKYRLPIYITENGIPDQNDQKRAKFIYDHLREITTMIHDNIDIRRYYHWSLLDNLEWNDGYGPKFGLIEVNYQTFERTIRESGHFYADIIAHKAVTKEAITKYLK